MQNKKRTLISGLLPLTLLFITINLYGQTAVIKEDNQTTNLFFKKIKPPVLLPEKKVTLPQSPALIDVASGKTPPIAQPVTPVQQMQLIVETPQKTPIETKKAPAKQHNASSNANVKKHKKALIKDVEAQTSIENKKLSFAVKNSTGKTVYIVCFAYIKKRALGNWRWDKSATYKMENEQKRMILTEEVEDEEDRSNVFGYLGIFDNKNEADESTFELLPDGKKIDLDLIAQLKDKTVKIEISKYGFLGNFYDYDFVKNSNKKVTKMPELDFTIENKTGKTILATCFVYAKKAKGTWLAEKTTESWKTVNTSRDDMNVWHFIKTPVIKIESKEKGFIDVDTIIEPRDRSYVRGYLVLFDEAARQDAEDATYEILPSSAKKLELGVLANLKNKNIVIYTEMYGPSQFIDYTVQPLRPIDLNKVTRNIK